MLYGQELESAIKELGFTKRSFALMCMKEDGKTLSPQAIDDLIRKPNVKAKEETQKAVESVLNKACKCCGNYTENPDAWNHTATSPEGGGRKRKR